MVNKAMNILIVDDSMTMLSIIDGILKQLGFSNIERAMNGQQALLRLKEKKYDLILSDWNMEPMDGLELLKQVRTNPQTKSIPVILITAESKADNIIAAKRAGVNNYVVKPFTAATLKEKMCSVIGQFS